MLSAIFSSALLIKLPHHHHHFSKCAMLTKNTQSARLFSSTVTHDSEGVLSFREKPYSSIEIDVTDDICADSSDFAVKLWTTIGFARKSNKKSILLNFNVQQANYMPIAK